MGMFDSIQWDYILPDEDDVGLEFQTKSFDCGMDKFRVDKNGNLFLRNRLDNDIMFPSRWIDPKDPEWISYKLTCDINFYTYNEAREWVEYNAHIDKGKVVLVYAVKGESDE